MRQKAGTGEKRCLRSRHANPAGRRLLRGQQRPRGIGPRLLETHHQGGEKRAGGAAWRWRRTCCGGLPECHFPEPDLPRLRCCQPLSWIALALLATTGPAAFAGTLSGSAWTASGCGAQPVAPVVDLKNVDAYNASIERVNAYLPLLKTYIDCVTQEANGDLKAVSQSANASQAEAREAREKILSDVKAAEAKFK
jgi:hypothetical protein